MGAFIGESYKILLFLFANWILRAEFLTRKSFMVTLDDAFDRSQFTLAVAIGVLQKETK
jgi:hypothetical protein